MLHGPPPFRGYKIRAPNMLSNPCDSKKQDFDSDPQRSTRKFRASKNKTTERPPSPFGDWRRYLLWSELGSSQNPRPPRPHSPGRRVVPAAALGPQPLATPPGLGERGGLGVPGPHRAQGPGAAGRLGFGFGGRNTRRSFQQKDEPFRRVVSINMVQAFRQEVNMKQSQ